MGTRLDGVNGATEPAWRRVVMLYAETYLLSPRELKVLEGAVAGSQDKHIAASCACSRSTVATYWKRIFAKTGMRPQREVLAHLLRFACDLMPAPQPTGEAESEIRIRLDATDVEATRRRPRTLGLKLTGAQVSGRARAASLRERLTEALFGHHRSEPSVGEVSSSQPSGRELTPR